MLKKLLAYLKLAWYSMFFGMRRADAEMTSGTEEDSEGTSIEQQKEEHNKYAAMLRGEVTQEVVETRYEMYHADRKSHDYIYSGGGHAVKKNNLLDYEGSVENSDGHKIILVQDNYQDMATVDDYGVDVGKVSASGSSIYEPIKGEGIAKKEYTIKIERDFIPKFKLEEFAKKIVVKTIDDKYILDIYVSKYPVQFDRRSRMFVNMINEIYEGNWRSELLDFQSLSFLTKKAYGADDMIYYSFNNFSFADIVEFDGNYVLRFLCEMESRKDLIDDFYDEIAAKKVERCAPRDGVAIDFDAAAEMASRDAYDADTAIKLIDTIKEE